MKLVGFSINKIDAEKFSSKAGKLNLKSNLNISSINKIDSQVLKTEETILSVDFVYTINYKPDFAKIEFKGNILIALEPEKAEDVLNQWQNKKMPDDFNVNLFNLILKRITIKALEIEDEMGLPFHISMPKVKRNSNNS